MLIIATPAPAACLTPHQRSELCVAAFSPAPPAAAAASCAAPFCYEVRRNAQIQEGRAAAMPLSPKVMPLATRAMFAE